MTDEIDAAAPPRPRNKTQMVLVGLMVVMLVATQALSHRPRFLMNRPLVVHVADLAQDKVNQLQDRVEGGVSIPNERFDPPIGMKAKPDYSQPLTEPALGYSIREVAILGMPLYAYTEKGLVLYAKDDAHFLMAPLDAEALKLLGDEKGPAGSGYAFPMWEYVWGWGLFALIAAWVFVWWRSGQKYRQDTGIL